MGVREARAAAGLGFGGSGFRGLGFRGFKFSGCGVGLWDLRGIGFKV